MEQGRRKMKENKKCKGDKCVKKAEDFFVFVFMFFCFACHFSETTETFSGSTKMEISTGKRP